MALMTCKACGEKTAMQANPCPYCGAPNPAMPDELKQLYKELDALQEEERRQQDLYERHFAQIDEFPWLILHLWRNVVLDRKVKKHTVLANEALARKKAKREEIRKLEQALREQS